MIVRWHANPVIAVVLIAGGFVILFTQAEDRLTDLISALFILVGGIMGGFYAGYLASKRTRRKRPAPTGNRS